MISVFAFIMICGICYYMGKIDQQIEDMKGGKHD